MVETRGRNPLNTGRESATVRSEENNLMDIFAFLRDAGVPYERYDHPPVHTVEEALRDVPPLPGAKTKNLFLCDRRGHRHFLVVVGFEKRVDLKALKGLLGVSALRFGSPRRLHARLGVEPGAVSLLGLVNDRDREVEVIMDRAVWESAQFQCHPLVNTSTLLIPREGIQRFFRATAHEPRVMEVP